MLLRSFLRVAPLAVLLAGCGQSLPTFPLFVQEGGAECVASSTPTGDGGSAMDAGAARACPSGQVCLQGRCYAACTADTQCAVTDICSNGVCRSRTGPAVDMGPPGDTGPAGDGGRDAGRGDMGPPDTGPVNPCAGVMCTAPQVCHPVSGTCVQCQQQSDCGGMTPICDKARGACVAFSGTACSPCNNAPDCMGNSLCVDRGTPLEKVCLPRCAPTCPAGMVCETNGPLTGMVCIPRFGTCTTYQAGAARRACTIDADCAPLGATSADFLFPMSCGGTAPTRCRYPCSGPTDCVVGTCGGDPSFCQ